MSDAKAESKDSPLCITGTLGVEGVDAVEPRKIAVDASEVDSAQQAIAALFERGILEHVPDELLHRIKSFVTGGIPKVCITPFTAASSADHHVIGLRVGGELEEIAVAARAVKLGLHLGGVGHAKASYAG